MSDKIEYSRLLQKRFTQPGIAPTIPASGATSLSQLLYTDLLIGEIAFNLPDKRMWFRAETEIVEIFGVSGGTYANLFIEGNSNTSINSIPNNDSGGLNSGEYNFTVGQNNTTFSDNSSIIGGFDNTINIDSDSSAIIGGFGNVISGATNVVMLGCENIDAFQSGSTYVQNLVITDVPTSGDTNTDLILLRGVNGAITAVPVSDLPGGTVTVSNGLTQLAGDIKLGGTLTEDTTIDTSTFYNISTKGGSKSGWIDDGYFTLEPSLALSLLGVTDINGYIEGDGSTDVLSQSIKFILPEIPGAPVPGDTYFQTNDIVIPSTSPNEKGIIGSAVRKYTGTDYLRYSHRVSQSDVSMEVSNTTGLFGDSIRIYNDNTRNNLIITNNLETDATQKGMFYAGNGTDILPNDFSTAWDATTPDSMLATKGYVDRATSGGTGGGTVTTYNQFPSGFDSNAFYDDGTLEFSWNAPSNRIEIKMLISPGGTGDMRSLATRSDGTSQNTFITTPNFTYSLFTSGVSAGDRCTITIGAEEDPSFPFYEITIYNMGSSYNTSVKIDKIN